ncbi:MAG: four helix bundle protein [Candidatus Paceibacterota bacterium]
MSTIKRFEDMEAWQLAKELNKEIYSIAKSGNFSRDFELKKQIIRSSGSIMDNIAEGFERGGKGEFIQFLGIAKGSAGEVRSQLHRAFDQAYIDKNKFDELYNKADRVGKMINGLISYLNKTEIKGQKYKKP